MDRVQAGKQLTHHVSDRKGGKRPVEFLGRPGGALKLTPYVFQRGEITYNSVECRSRMPRAFDISAFSAEHTIRRGVHVT